MKKFIPKNFIIDADGVLTDGTFCYSAHGKVMKMFGANDNDMLHLIKDRVHIHVVSSDKRGFAITKKRIDDMGFPVDLVSPFDDRILWLSKKFNCAETIYMGDGVFDALVFDAVGYGIAPANAFFATKKYADYITKARGGEGAVAEACWHIMEKFFTPLHSLQLFAGEGSRGVWGKINKKDAL